MSQLPTDTPASQIPPPESGPSLWNRLSIVLREAIHLAEVQCTSERAISVDDSHLFAGLLLVKGESSNGLLLLTDLGVDVEALTASLTSSGFIKTSTTWPPSPKNDMRQVKLSLAPSASEVFRQASDFAAGLGHERIGTEHLVLAFLAMPNTFAYRVLTGFNVKLDAARERLVAKMVSGNYRIEPSAAPVGLPMTMAANGRPGIVYQLYRTTRIGYLVLIFIPLLASILLPASLTKSLATYLSLMSGAIYFFIVPYVLSTYAMAYLLRSRAIQGLFDMPPSKSMVQLGLPFTLSLTIGGILALSVIPMFIALDYASAHIVKRSLDIPALIGCLLVTVNSVVAVVTHLLLTFNIRGQNFSLPISIPPKKNQ